MTKTFPHVLLCFLAVLTTSILAATYSGPNMGLTEPYIPEAIRRAVTSHVDLDGDQPTCTLSYKRDNGDMDTVFLSYNSQDNSLSLVGLGLVAVSLVDEFGEIKSLQEVKAEQQRKSLKRKTNDFEFTLPPDAKRKMSYGNGLSSGHVFPSINNNEVIMGRGRDSNRPFWPDSNPPLSSFPFSLPSPSPFPSPFASPDRANVHGPLARTYSKIQFGHFEENISLKGYKTVLVLFRQNLFANPVSEDSLSFAAEAETVQDVQSWLDADPLSSYGVKMVSLHHILLAPAAEIKNELADDDFFIPPELLYDSPPVVSEKKEEPEIVISPLKPLYFAHRASVNVEPADKPAAPQTEDSNVVSAIRLETDTKVFAEAKLYSNRSLKISHEGGAAVLVLREDEYLVKHSNIPGGNPMATPVQSAAFLNKSFVLQDLEPGDIVIVIVPLKETQKAKSFTDFYGAFSDVSMEEFPEQAETYLKKLGEDLLVTAAIISEENPAE